MIKKKKILIYFLILTLIISNIFILIELWRYKLYAKEFIFGLQEFDNYPNQYKNSPKLMCAILTTENNILERGSVLAVWSTWANKCDKTIFICNCPTIKRIKSQKDIKFEEKTFSDLVFSKNHRNKDNFDKKFNEVVQLPFLFIDKFNPSLFESLYAAFKIFTYFGIFDWFFFGFDDTMVIIDNLINFIEIKNNSENNFYTSNKNMKLTDELNSYKSGILFPKESIQRIRNYCNLINEKDLVKCFSMAKVFSGNSRDKLGNDLFQVFNRNSKSNDNFLRNLQNNNIIDDYFSKETISFENITADEMFLLKLYNNIFYKKTNKNL